MSWRAQASSILVIFLLVGLIGPGAIASTVAPIDIAKVSLRQHVEMLRWTPGPGTIVDLASVKVLPISGGGTLPTFRLDNQPDPAGGGVVFACSSPAGTFGASFAYRSVGSSDPPRESAFQLTCLNRWNTLEMRANGLARRVEFQEDVTVLQTITIPLESSFRVRPDNRPPRGGIEVVCESPFEGRIDYRYKYNDLDPPVVNGTMMVICIQF